MAKLKLYPSVEDTKIKLYDSVEDQGKASYTDKVLGAVRGVVEKGGGSPKPLTQFMDESRGATDTALDGAYGMAQGLTYNLADEGYGAVRAMGDERPFSEAYPEHRDEAREAWAEARDRSPFAAGGGEVVGAMLSPNKVFGAGKGLRGLVRGAAEGGTQAFGASDSEDAKGMAIDTALGAGAGLATGAVANLATKGFSKSPNATRAEVLGAKGKDYRVDGPGDRKKIVERITKTGMLKNRKMKYDVDSGTFKTVGKSKFQIDELEKNTEDRLLGRAEDAISELQNRKESYYGKILDNRFVPMSYIDNMASEIAEEYAKRGLLKGPMARNEAVTKVKDNILDQAMNLGSDTSKISLRQLDQLKRMAQEDVRNFSKGLGELGDNDELARITARKLKNLVEDNIGDANFGKLNSSQHDFLTVKGDLQNKLKTLELATPASSNVNKTSMLEGTVDGFLGGSQGRLDRASSKEWWQKSIPKPVRAVIPYALEETPGVIYRQNMEGQGMKGNYRDPSSVPNIPEQLIRTPLPRSTSGLLDKKPFVLAKIAQMMPEMLDAVQDVYDNNPENLSELAQVISMKMPHVFEKDKYNRFDGRIVSEVDKQKAIKDTLLNNGLSSIEQAKIITRLNKEGLFEG